MYLYAEEEVQEEKAEPKKKKGPPPKWDAFLKERYQDGKKKVPNSNPKTRDRFPTVSMTTLMGSDSGFRKKVFKEYSEWIKKQDKDKPSKSKGKKEKEPSSPKRAKLVFDVEDKIKKFGKNHKEHFEKAWSSAREAFEGKHETWRPQGVLTESARGRAFQEQEIAKMSLDEKALCFYNHKFHNPEIESSEVEKYLEGWRDSALSIKGLGLQGLVMGMGVKGSFTNLSALQQSHIEDGQSNTFLKEGMSDVYAYTQACFRHAGITHVTLYRGVDGQGLQDVPPKAGDKVKLETRPLSSWSIEPYVGSIFGSSIVKVRVPVEAIFACPITHENFGRHTGDYGENEFIVMGSSEYEAEVTDYNRK